MNKKDDDQNNPKTCDDCPHGYYQDTEGQASCLPCLPGEFGDETGLLKCHKCGVGKVSAISESRNCSDCDAGRYQKREGQALCLPCLPGKFGNEMGLESCTSCPAGYMQENSSGTMCARVNPDSIVNTINGMGGSSSSKIALGWHATECEGTGNSRVCIKDEPCKAGTKGTVPPSENCTECDPGKFSYPGSLTCERCGIGKYAKEKGSANCSTCPDTMINTEPGQAACKNCPSGYKGDSGREVHSRSRLGTFYGQTRQACCCRFGPTCSGQRLICSASKQ